MDLRVPSSGKVVTFNPSSSAAADRDLDPRYFFGLCPDSLRMNEDSTQLKACSGCLSVCYAGKEEQKRDWKRHKAVCKVLQNVGEVSQSALLCSGIVGSCVEILRWSEHCVPHWGAIQRRNDS